MGTRTCETRTVKTSKTSGGKMGAAGEEYAHKTSPSTGVWVFLSS
jgi:hypothetical protein